MFDVVQWMKDHGHPGYSIRIDKFKAALEILSGEPDDDGLAALLTAKIAEVKREAEDRYDDWATDIDYE